MPTVGQTIKTLQGYDKDAPVAYTIWFENDVAAADADNILSQEERAEVLESLHENFDANHGITWNTVRWEVEDLIKYKKEQEQDD